MDAATLVTMLESQPQRGVARLLSWIEDENPRAVEVLQATWSRTGNSYVIGVTGPPGGGKSTLVDCLAVHAAAQGHAVGVLAVDPTSPFSGGAVLGDRLRMSDAQRRGIFIRSVATRGHLGGLTVTTRYLVNALELLGCDLVFVETVGAGQGDVEVVQLADTTVVVEVPGLGDEVQVQKAGILEIGDLLLVNKSDRPGADRLAQELRSALDLGGQRNWQPPVLQVTAIEQTGIAETWDAIGAHRAHMEAGPLEADRLARQMHELEQQLQQKLFRDRIISVGDAALRSSAQKVLARKADPFTAIDRLAN